MLLIVCPGCGHSNREMGKVSLNAKLRCLACGSHVGRIHRHFKGWLTNLVERAPPIEEARRDTYHGLLYLADSKGYREGWAAWKFKTLYWEWPLSDYGKTLLRPYHELEDWIRIEKNRFKAARKREEVECIGDDIGTAGGSRGADGIGGGQVGEAVHADRTNSSSLANSAGNSDPSSADSELMDQDDWNTDL